MNHAKKLKAFLKSLSKKQITLTTGALLILGGGAYAFFGGGNGVETVKAEMGQVREEVVVTGKVVSSSSVKLGFERGGKVVQSNIEVGTKVTEGQTLVVLDQNELLANLNKAKATLNKALVELESTKRESASSYTQAVNDLVESLQEAYIQADDAVRNDSDRFFTNPRESSAQFDPSFSDGTYTYLSSISSATKSSLSSHRVEMEVLLNTWNKEMKSIETTRTGLESAFTMTRNNLRSVQTFLDEIASAINSISTEDLTYKTTINGYKATVSEARSQITTALSSISTAKSAYNNAPYIETGVGNYDDVLAEEARIESLREDVRAYEADLRKTVITAPITGVVTQADAKKGEIVTAGTTLVSILSEQKLRVEANVSEISIGRVETGNTAVINFDAFPSENYEGIVTYVDPAEVLVDEVPTYKVTVSFNSELPERVRSGLTANLKILTAVKDNVVKIPAYVVSREKGEYFVEVQTSQGVEKRKIEVGLRGEDSTLEVLSGLSAGTEILVK